MARNKGSVYIDIDESTTEVALLEHNIMVFVTVWVKTNKTPVPKISILREMEGKGVKDFQVDHALNLLLRNNFIRRAYSSTNKTSYVQIRSISIV